MNAPLAPAVAPIRNAFSIDVEDYFQVSAFASCIARSEWDAMDCRIERNVDVILGLLDDHGVR
ncbi:MAG: polysaccharide deacetylase family protein, partial [Betaproteobacteria bacterium]